MSLAAVPQVVLLTSGRRSRRSHVLPPAVAPRDAHLRSGRVALRDIELPGLESAPLSSSSSDIVVSIAGASWVIGCGKDGPTRVLDLAALSRGRPRATPWSSAAGHARDWRETAGR